MQGSLAHQFGYRIRELRNIRNLSQEQLAEMCSLHRTFIGRVERGETNVTLENIQKLATGLNVPLADLFHYPKGNGRDK